MDLRAVFAEHTRQIYQHINDGVQSLDCLLDEYTGKVNDIRQKIENYKKNNADGVENIGSHQKQKTERTTSGKKRECQRRILKEPNVEQPKIKLEKLSINSQYLPEKNVTVKQEKNPSDIMPPPAELPKRTRANKKGTTTFHIPEYVSALTKEKEKSDTNTERDSDVLVEKQKISIIALSDTEESDDEVVAGNRQKPKTKTNNKKKAVIESKRSKVRSKMITESESDNSEIDGKNQVDDTQNVRITRTKTRAKTKSKIEDDQSKSAAEINKTKTLTKQQIKNEQELSENKQTDKTITIKDKEKLKRLRSCSPVESGCKSTDGSEQKINNVKKSKIMPPSDNKIGNDSKKSFEDAIDQTYTINNQTYNIQQVTKDNENMMKETDKLQNPSNNEYLITDDESVVEETPPKVKKQTKKQKATKLVSNFYNSSPVKMRIEAFEKLRVEVNSSEIPVRMTRTKKKAIEKEAENDNNRIQEENKSVKEKSKAITPLQSNRFIPKFYSSVSKAQNILMQKKELNDESLISTKSASALKMSQKEFTERELKRREKEAEALRKREALLQAQIEEKKRRREEKQLKAQHQREALEKERQRMFEEMEQQKEEKTKQILAEKEEKKQMKKEEANKKRFLALKKAEEKKREEEIRKKMEEELQRQQLTEKNKKMEWRSIFVNKQTENADQPLYLTQQPPLLPTNDCYDSDDSRKSDRPNIPSWATRSQLHEMSTAMFYAGYQIRNTFFRCNAQTPDLLQIFYKMDSRKLKRTSSAIWHEPPRYTQIFQSKEV